MSIWDRITITLNDEKNVLSIGFGDGREIIALSQKVPQNVIHGIEVSPQRIKIK